MTFKILKQSGLYEGWNRCIIDWSCTSIPAFMFSLFFSGNWSDFITFWFNLSLNAYSIHLEFVIVLLIIDPFITPFYEFLVSPNCELSLDYIYNRYSLFQSLWIQQIQFRDLEMIYGWFVFHTKLTCWLIYMNINTPWSQTLLDIIDLFPPKFSFRDLHLLKP